MSALEHYSILIIGSGEIGRRLAIYVNGMTHCVTLVCGHKPFASAEIEREWLELSFAFGDRLIFGAFKFVDLRIIVVQPSNGGPERRLAGNKVFIDLAPDDCHATSEKSSSDKPWLRCPSEKLGLGEAGVKLDAGGLILVDEELQTSSFNTWAMGQFAVRRFQSRAIRSDFEIAKAHALQTDDSK